MTQEEFKKEVGYHIQDSCVGCVHWDWAEHSPVCVLANKHDVKGFCEVTEEGICDKFVKDI